jgi:hypothetical protein
MLNVILLSAALIWIHDWYPKECCEEAHCHPVPCEEIRSKDSTYIWKNHVWSKSQAKASPDGRCHVCAVGEFGPSLCIFLGGTS